MATSEEKDELLELATDLRRTGARVELRELVGWEESEHFVIRGKIRELKKHANAGKWREEVEKWERRIGILGEILESGEISYDEFLDRFMKAEDPKIYESAKRLMNKDLDFGELASSAENLLRVKIVMDELEHFLAINGVKVGESVKGKLPEDPEVAIIVDEQIEGSKKLVLLDYFPVYELYVDVLSLLGEEVDHKALRSLLAVVSNIILSSEEIEDLERLKELSSCVMSEGEEEVFINCEEVFDLIVRSLEKVGIVRVSGKKIRFRKRNW